MKQKKLLLQIIIINITAIIIYTAIQVMITKIPLLSALASATKVATIITIIMGSPVIIPEIIVPLFTKNKKSSAKPTPVNIKKDSPHSTFNPKLGIISAQTNHKLNPSNIFEALVLTNSIWLDDVEDVAEKKSNSLFFSTPQVQTASCLYKDTDYMFSRTTPKLYSQTQDDIWQSIHNGLLEVAIDAIKEAINQHAPAINITYLYDGLWAYAAGYWPTNDYPEAKEYVAQLGKLSQHIQITFTKFNRKSANYQYESLIDESKRIAILNY